MIIYSPACCSKPACFYFFTKEDIVGESDILLLFYNFTLLQKPATIL